MGCMGQRVRLEKVTSCGSKTEKRVVQCKSLLQRPMTLENSTVCRVSVFHEEFGLSIYACYKYCIFGNVDDVASFNWDVSCRMRSQSI